MRVWAIAAVAAVLAGCASITDGTSQTLIFKMDPADARCSLSRDGVELGSVSGKVNTITVSKGAKDIIVACSAEGYESKTMRLVSTTQTSGVVGGIFLDLGITDMLTGAMWKYPGEVAVALDRSRPPVAAIPPAAATAAPQAAAAPVTQ